MKKALALSILVSAVLFGPQALAQDAALAEKKAQMCIGCHGIIGYQATHPEVYKVPKIAGQNAKFLEAALVAYRKGERRHPSMRGIAGSLSDQDITDLAAYYEGQYKPAERAPDAAAAADGDTAALLTKGACASCHGANYSKPIDPSYPKLAGQHADYLYAALRAYQHEKGAVVGRTHAIMGAQVKAFNPKELKAMARYLASLPGEMATVPQAKLVTHTAAK